MSELAQNGKLYVPGRYKRSLTVGYVSGATVHESFMVSMIGLFGYDASQRRIITSMTRGKGLYVPDNRNHAVRAFLESTTEYLLFVDTDIVFQAHQVYQLLDAADPVERPIVSGLYFTYMDDGRIYPVWHERYEDGTLGTVRKISPEITELVGTGMGFCIIHRRVLEAMREARPRHRWAWFAHDEMDYGTEIMSLGEDLTFCLRAEKLGFKTYGHGGVIVEHEKGQRITLDTFQRNLKGRSNIENPRENHPPLRWGDTCSICGIKFDRVPLSFQDEHGRTWGHPAYLSRGPIGSDSSEV